MFFALLLTGLCRPAYTQQDDGTTLAVRGLLPLKTRLSRQVLTMSDASTRARTPTRPSPRIVVVTLPAEVDVTNSEQVYQTLARALSGTASVVIANATETTFCGCAGVDSLIRGHQQATAAGTQLRVAAGPAIQRILKLTGAYDILDTYLTVDAAQDGELQIPGGSYRAPHLRRVRHVP